MNWILTSIVCLLLVELALRLPFAAVITAASRSGTGALRVIRARTVSDHWKEKAMAGYAQRTFLSSMKLMGLLAILIVAASTLVVAFERAFSGFQGFILGWRGAAFGIAFASIYVVARRSLTRGHV